jgi:hypothetical protein
MKRKILTFSLLSILMLSFSSQVCLADWNTYETRQQAYDRRSNENYNTYKNNNYQQPLGGYNRPINDNGGRQYGSSNNNSGFGSLNNSRNSNSWNNY